MSHTERQMEGAVSNGPTPQRKFDRLTPGLLFPAIMKELPFWGIAAFFDFTPESVIFPTGAVSVVGMRISGFTGISLTVVSGNGVTGAGVGAGVSLLGIGGCTFPSVFVGGASLSGVGDCTFSSVFVGGASPSGIGDCTFPSEFVGDASLFRIGVSAFVSVFAAGVSIEGEADVAAGGITLFA